MKSSNSETTGSPEATRALQSWTGHERGIIGFSPSEQKSARDWLVRQTPDQVDAALGAWVSNLLGSAPKVITELRFPTDDSPAYSVAVGANVAVRTQEEAAQALRKYQGAMTQPEKEQTENWFYAMRLATASSAKSDMDEVGRMAIYVAELSRYPADVTKAVFDHFTRSPRDGTSWLPTLPEMVSMAERLVSSRRAVIAALEKWTPETEDSRKRKRIRDLMIAAKELEDSIFLMRRSKPEEYAKAHAKVKEMRAEADKLRRGEEPVL